MKICILMGSPRINGNTASLADIFEDELKNSNVEIERINLYDKNIKPCIGCRKCQEVSGAFGCPQKDDMDYIFDSIIKSDIFVLATPIYSWYCTPPMKALLDRLVYGMNKYYGLSGIKECLWEDKKCAVISTCGYKIEYGADLFKEGIIRYCKHSKLDFSGIYTARDNGYNEEFIDDKKIEEVREFANSLIS